jgi:hypothetical protein
MSTFLNIKPTNHGWNFGYGFFSNYRVCLEQLIDNHEKNTQYIPYVNWDKTTWIEGFNPFESTVFTSSYNPFDQWFDQQIPTNFDTIIQCNSPLRPDLISHDKHYFDEPDQLQRQQTVDKLYIKPKQYILDKIDEIYQKEFEGHVVLGVMARGTEYNFHHPMYGIFGVQDYINQIKITLKETPDITKIFIVSEDSEYVNIIANEFPSNYFLPNVFRRTDETLEYINKFHCWPNLSKKRPNHCKLLGEEVIIQTKLLGKCNFLIGRMSGVFAGAILWNENIKKIYKL